MHMYMHIIKIMVVVVLPIVGNVVGNSLNIIFFWIFFFHSCSFAHVFHLISGISQWISAGLHGMKPHVPFSPV